MAEIRAVVMGSVSFFSVEEGAKVESGQMLGAVECMKTMFDFRASCDGVVEFKVCLGQTVAQNDVLAIIKNPE